MKNINKLLIFTLALSPIVFNSCKKNDIVVPDKEVAFFSVPSAKVTHRVVSPSTVFILPVGLTKIPGGAKTVNIKVTSPSGAVAGTQYTISKTTVTFDPNKIVDTIIIKGSYATYLTGRKDTLLFSFTNAEDGVATLSNSFTLILRGACAEDDILFSDLTGRYGLTYENGSYGPYVSNINNATAINSTSSKATLTNIYDSGISAELTFNYATAGSFTVIAAPQSAGVSIGGQPHSIRTYATGSFSYCSQTFTIPFELYNTATGAIFDRWTTTLAR